VSLHEHRRTNRTKPFAVAIEIQKAIAPDLKNEIRGNFIFLGVLHRTIRPPPVYDDI
jgi:hypothetical protein